VSEARSAAQSLFGTKWVHVHEEDTDRGAVYRPEDSGIPLSRRPREAIELRPDGSAVVYVPGAADRPEATPAQWRDTAEGTVITRGSDEAQLVIVESSPERLLVRQREPRRDGR
jgi:hypothetical protein